MATNSRYDGVSITLDLDLGGAASSGDVALISDLVVFVLEDTDASDIASCELPGINRVVDLSVVGADNVGSAAVAVGDKVYLDAGVYNVDAVNGTHIGYALEVVLSGATTTIPVALAQTIVS